MSIHQRLVEDETPQTKELGVLSESPTEEPKGRAQEPSAPALEPTRFGDWERAGRCIDF